MTQNNENYGSVWPVIFVIVLVGTLLSAFTTKQISQQPTPVDPDRSSFEHRYVKERVKLEGYSDKEAQQAADAIIKFHNAQQARKR
jgi:hypothetical protein